MLVLKAFYRKKSIIWRKTCTTIHFDIYYDSCKAVKKTISKRKSELMGEKGSLIVKETRKKSVGAVTADTN